MAIVAFAISSCGSPEKKTEKEPQVKSFDTLVEPYIKAQFKNATVEFNGIDSRIITSKKRLRSEARKLRRQLESLLNDGDRLKKYIEETKESGENVAELELGFEKMREETTIKLALLKEIELRMAKASTKKMAYFLVKVNVVITQEDGTVVRGRLPFHISSDYKILKGPDVLSKEFYNENSL